MTPQYSTLYSQRQIDRALHYRSNLEATKPHPRQRGSYRNYMARCEFYDTQQSRWQQRLEAAKTRARRFYATIADQLTEAQLLCIRDLPEASMMRSAAIRELGWRDDIDDYDTYDVRHEMSYQGVY